MPNRATNSLTELELGRITQSTSDQLFCIGGVIRDERGETQANIEVRLVHGWLSELLPDGKVNSKRYVNGTEIIYTPADVRSTMTCQTGRYCFKDLTAGIYTLIVRLAPDKARAYSIVVPAYDFAPEQDLRKC